MFCLSWNDGYSYKKPVEVTVMTMSRGRAVVGGWVVWEDCPDSPTSTPSLCLIYNLFRSRLSRPCQKEILWILDQEWTSLLWWFMSLIVYSEPPTPPCKVRLNLLSKPSSSFFSFCQPPAIHHQWLAETNISAETKYFSHQHGLVYLLNSLWGSTRYSE